MTKLGEFPEHCCCVPFLSFHLGVTEAKLRDVTSSNGISNHSLLHDFVPDTTIKICHYV